MACVGSIGKITLATETFKGFNVVRAVARLPVDHSKINRNYLSEFLKTEYVQNYFRDETRTVSQPTLNISQIELTPVLSPPLDRQKRFGELHSQYNKLERQLSEVLQTIDQLFNSLERASFQ